MEHWREIDIKSGEVELISAENVALHHGAFRICENGTLALTPTSLHYTPPNSTIKWSLPLESIQELRREPSGYLSSGKIHFQLAHSSESSRQKTNTRDKVVWQCQVCEEINETAGNNQQTCALCGSIQKGALLIVQIDAKTDQKPADPWTCEVCQDQNDGHAKSCSSCGFGKPVVDKMEPTNRIKWTCTACTFVNTEESDTCLVCDTPKSKDAHTENTNTNQNIFTASLPRYKVSFRSGGSTAFYVKLLATHQAILTNKYTIDRDNTATVGIAGLLKLQEEKNQKTEASLSSAFSDLDALMRSAGEMVTLAARISDRITNKLAKDDLSAPERTAFANLIDSLGIEHTDLPGNNENGISSEFYDSIAKNVSNLVQAMVSKTGTRVFSLADVYCIYNRTRTTGSLIAPADLLKAARQLTRLALPIRLHKFTQKGMYCLISAQDVNPLHLYDLLAQLMREKTPVTAVDLAERMKVSLLLAGQQLDMAESAGKIVRDAKRKDLPAFYPNMILESA